MIRTVSSLALIALMSGSALAASNACSTAPASRYKPQSELTAMLATKGITVRKIKVESGCYEVYAVGKDGKKLNLAYNAETLANAGNAEAGED
jgi:hypothetical protein